MRIGRRVGLAVLAGLALVGAFPSAGSDAQIRRTSATTTRLTCGHEALPKTWVCTFDDEFSATKLDGTKWWVQTTAATGFRNGPECYVASTNNISEGSGVLQLTAREEPTSFTCKTPSGSYTSQYTSGMVSTFGRFSQAYGRFEVRAEVPAATVAGLQESFWLWPQNPSIYPGPWPTAGEIDIAELYSTFPTLAVPHVHYVSAGQDPYASTYSCTISDPAAFHTYAVEWTPQAVTFSYDGKTCLVDSWQPAAPLVKPQPFDQPFVVALTQALGIGNNAFDPATTPLPATTRIDYVRVWRRQS